MANHIIAVGVHALLNECIQKVKIIDLNKYPFCCIRILLLPQSMIHLQDYREAQYMK